MRSVSPAEKEEGHYPTLTQLGKVGTGLFFPQPGPSSRGFCASGSLKGEAPISPWAFGVYQPCPSTKAEMYVTQLKTSRHLTVDPRRLSLQFHPPQICSLPPPPAARPQLQSQLMPLSASPLPKTILPSRPTPRAKSVQWLSPSWEFTPLLHSVQHRSTSSWSPGLSLAPECWLPRAHSKSGLTWSWLGWGRGALPQ